MKGPDEERKVRIWKDSDEERRGRRNGGGGG